MARIRTIKPEFPQSESVGRLSRDARLLFIMLWTYVDDSGRARAASRMLASLLYPYDDDARDLLPAWLDELEAEKCIKRYEVDGSQYLEVCNWLTHQKIDRPTPSKIPAPPQSIASPREPSRVSSDGSVSGSGPVSGPVPVPGSVSLARDVPRGTFDGWRFIDESLRPAYPRGTFRHTHWLNASKLAEALADAGVDPGVIVANAEAYRLQVEAAGNEGTRYVMAPTTFLSDCNWQGPFPIAQPPQRPREETPMERIQRLNSPSRVLDGEVVNG